MDFSPFPSPSAAVLAGLDVDWLPDYSTMNKQLIFFNNNNSQVSGGCGDGSPTSPPQSQPLTPPHTNIIHQTTCGFLSPSSSNYSASLLQSTCNDHQLLERTVSPSSPPPATPEILLMGSSFFAARDFQKKNQRAESPVSCESSITIEGMGRACRYSPQERKERIERYRTKRNQRNFNKKIKYACRKSLADSRPRIRGRFARYNDEVVKNYPVQWSSHGRGEEDQEEASGGDNWIKYFMDAYSANLIP